MEAQEFKSRIKEIKELLRGLTIQFCSKNHIRPFYTLLDFGSEILKHADFGHSFSVSQVWIGREVKAIEHFEDFISVLQGGNVTAVRVNAFHEDKSEFEFMRNFASLD